jgi:hypothetical protein
MAHPIITWIFNYLFRVLGNWAGILLAIDAIVALSERYLGDFTEQRFNKKFHLSKELKWGFAVVVFLIAQGVAYRDLEGDLEQANSRNGQLLQLNVAQKGKQEGLEHENLTLRDELMAKDRPVILQYTTDPQIAKMLNQQTQELLKLKNSLPSPKKKALQLSNDMIKFSQDITRNLPTLPAIRTASREEYIAQMDQFSRGYAQFLNNKAADYNGQFSVRLASLEEDIKAAGLPDSLGMCQHSNGNTFMMENCATLVGVLADKLP